jgi:spoIIIJ-associated protein
MIEANTLKSIKEIIAGVIEKLGIEADIEVREQPDTVVFNIRTPDSNMIIGQHGVNLSALQYICRVLVKRKLSDTVDFVIDVDDYKKKRESYLSSMAQKAYKEAINKNCVVVFKPMSSYERRIVHASLSNLEGIITDSIGEEPSRMVTIRPVGTNINGEISGLQFSEQEDYLTL